jgi:cell division protease FtsH
MPRKNDSWNSKKKKKPLGGGPLPPMDGWKNSIVYIFVAIISISMFNWLLVSADSSVVPYSEFKDMVAQNQIVRIEMDKNYYTGYTNAPTLPTDGRPMATSGRTTYKTVPVYDPEFTKLLDEKGVTYSAMPMEGNALLAFVLNWLIPIGFMFALWHFLQKRMSGMGSNVLSVGQNKNVIVAEGDVKTRFLDVAGVDEAKEELVEVVDFLKSPKKYTDIGGKIPKGVLLLGPPGTGKTLLARAVAGEAGVPFFRMSGAEFVEMFVGVGAARVRDLFKQAREKAPCIVFIDELDAIGKSRLNGMGGGNDEREQTLNQLLVEMDGFDATSGLIILAATNRPDVLDPALLRPGRFDRQVAVDRPDLVGREAILNIHAKTVKLDIVVDLKKVARSTPGFVGADLANVVNEAALLAVRAGRKKVEQKDFEKAVEKIMTGLEKKSRVMNPDERKVIAYHEAGHALVAAFTPDSDPVQKVTIVPRGFGALGFTLQVPIEDRYIVTQDKLIGEIDVLLGGRAAEDLVFGKISTGASNDITRATDIARRMITDYGMSERYRNVALTKRGAGLLGPGNEQVMAREYGEETQKYIDETVAGMLALRYEEAKRILTAYRSTLVSLAEELLDKETIDEARFKEMIGAVA